MSILQAIYQLLFGPLELFFEVVYGVAFHIVDGNAGAAVIPLSLCLNFLLLPLYNRADAIQREEHDRQQLMAPGVEHINKVFKGDERYMMLQAFYRVHAYKPLYALRSSLPLLLEIPFFVAAFHFLSNLADFHDTPFGPLVNLAAPDGLLQLGGISINLLPILMTAVNIVSSRIYAKDLSRKDKLQLYGSGFLLDAEQCVLPLQEHRQHFEAPGSRCLLAHVRSGPGVPCLCSCGKQKAELRRADRPPAWHPVPDPHAPIRDQEESR